MTEEQSILGKISEASIVVSGVLLFGMSFFIAFEVLIRKFLSLTTQGAEEYSSYALAFVSAWAFSYALLNKSHIRIDLLYTRLSQKLKYTLDILSLVSIAFFMLPVSYYAFEVVKTSFLRNSKANTPLKTVLWIPQSFWLLGIFFFTFVTIVLLAKTVHHLLRGEYLLAREMAGCPLVDEEIEEESGIPVGHRKGDDAP